MNGATGEPYPVGQYAFVGVQAFVGRQQRRMYIDNPVVPTIDEAFGQQAHKAGQTDQFDSGILSVCKVAQRFAAIELQIDGSRRDPNFFRPVESACARHIGDNADYFRGELFRARRRSGRRLTRGPREESLSSGAPCRFRPGKRTASSVSSRATISPIWNTCSLPAASIWVALSVFRRDDGDHPDAAVERARHFRGTDAAFCHKP